jgi:outer membrane protein insertion porin family
LKIVAVSFFSRKGKKTNFGHFQRQRILFIFLLLISTVLYGQILPIGAISFEGNTNTRTTYLQHFIGSSKGELIDSSLLENDLRKLRSLPGIMDAFYAIDSFKKDSVRLIFSVKERSTLLPVGDFGITSGNFWVGAGAMESNLAGKGLYLYGYYRYNNDHTAHIIFRIYLALAGDSKHNLRIFQPPTN